MKLFFGLLGLVALLLGAATSAVAQTAAAGDFIVALVNSEPITNAELDLQIKQLLEQRNQQGAPLAPTPELRSGVLERLINERAQLQLARDTGVRADAAAIDQAELNLATQNQMDLTQFRQALEKRGITTSTLREQLRDQILLTRLHEREVDSRVRITDADVNNAWLARQAAIEDPLAQEINLAQILVAVPENPSPAQVAQAQASAQQILARVRGGEAFETLVQQLSAADRNNGGQLGLRRADRYPPSFVAATQTLAVGELSDWVRSDAGFHLLKVVDRRAPALVQSITQTRARHILLRPGAQLSQPQALARLAAERDHILAGQVAFEAVARDISQDGSAAQGGDLGWATPGMYVPEFEQVLDRLKPGEISQPTVSRFGVHLMQVLERRRVELTAAQVREGLRNELRAKRSEEAYATWERDIRSRAFVEIREPQ
ncbi:MAG: peptidylprolyl isomerase [Betaproteobacteria bacterium]